MRYATGRPDYGFVLYSLQWYKGGIRSISILYNRSVVDTLTNDLYKRFTLEEWSSHF